MIGGEDRDAAGAEDRNEGPDRRSVLTAVTAGLAVGATGCLGPSGDPGGSGGSPTDTGDGSGDGADAGGESADADVSCGSLTEESVAHDTGALPVIFDFEYPAVIGDVHTTENSNNVVYTGVRDSAAVSLTVQLSQSTRPGSDVEMDQPVAATTEFDGETIEFYGASASNPIVWQGWLPWEKDGEVAYFRVQLNLSSSGDDSAACREALQTAAEALVASMQVNAETTIETEHAGQ